MYRPWLVKLSLVATDLFTLSATFAFVAWLNGADVRTVWASERGSVVAQVALIGMAISWFWLLLEHYGRRRPFADELREIFHVLVAMSIVASAIGFLASVDAPRNIHFLVWGASCLVLPLGRVGTRTLLDKLGYWARPCVIVGTGENARAAYLALKSESGMGYHVRAFIAPTPLDLPEHGVLHVGNDRLAVLYLGEPLERLPRTFGSPQIVVALESLNTQANQMLVQNLSASHTNVHVIPSIRGLPLIGTQLAYFFSHEVLLLTLRNNLSRRSSRWAKRTFDIVAASALIIALSPLLLYMCWRIWREDGRPVIFKQPRIARDHGEFNVLKFRSMVRDADSILDRWRRANSKEWQEYYSSNFKLKNDPRLLPIGHWMRNTSIDELPQLFNVLRGDMSLVGPRPLLARELFDYGDSIRLYRLVRPGMTGVWQVSGRSGTTFAERALLDSWYVRNWSLWHDIVILCKTVSVVIKRHGAQ